MPEHGEDEYIRIVNEYKSNIIVPDPKGHPGMTYDQRQATDAIANGAIYGCNKILQSLHKEVFKHPLLIAEEWIFRFSECVSHYERSCDEDPYNKSIQYMFKYFEAAHDAATEILDIFEAMF